MLWSNSIKTSSTASFIFSSNTKSICSSWCTAKKKSLHPRTLRRLTTVEAKVLHHRCSVTMMTSCLRHRDLLVLVSRWEIFQGLSLMMMRFGMMTNLCRILGSVFLLWKSHLKVSTWSIFCWGSMLIFQRLLCISVRWNFVLLEHIILPSFAAVASAQQKIAPSATDQCLPVDDKDIQCYSHLFQQQWYFHAKSDIDNKHSPQFTSGAEEDEQLKLMRLAALTCYIIVNVDSKGKSICNVEYAFILTIIIV